MRRFFSAAALVLVAVVGAIVLFELSLTVLSQWLYPRLIVSDSDLGWRYEANRSVERKVFLSDIFSQTDSRIITTNSLGFRDSEFRDDADVRIMLLGDSMTFGLKAGDEDIFARKLETLLSRRIGKDVDVMNFGVTGFGTAQEYFTLTKFAPVVRPQGVVLALWEENDFEDNAVYFSAGRYRPHFSIAGDGLAYVNRPTLLEKAIQFAKDNTILFTLIDNKFSLYSRRFDYGKDAKIELLNEIVYKAASYAKAEGMWFLLVYLRGENADHSYLDATMARCKERAIACEALSVERAQRIDGVGHLNAAGHERTAAAIADFLARHEFVDAKDEGAMSSTSSSSSSGATDDAPN